MEPHATGVLIICLTGGCEGRLFVWTVAAHRGACAFAGRDREHSRGCDVSCDGPSSLPPRSTRQPKATYMITMNVTQGYDCDNRSLSGIAPSDPLPSPRGAPEAFVV